MLGEKVFISKHWETIITCIQDTLSSRAALGLPSASREQRYLAYKIITKCSNENNYK